MIRLPNWQTRLSEYIASCARRKFSYANGFDCGMFVVDAIEAMTGMDLGTELKGAYTNRREAFSAIERLCGEATMEAVAQFIAAKYSIPDVPITFAQRGDPVVLRKGKRSSLGIIDMVPGFILTPYKDGLLRLPVESAKVTHAYHI